jgi:hypothetical protein
MAISAITPRVSALGSVVLLDVRGRFSCGQEHSAYVARMGSFADGQSGRAATTGRAGRFSTGQETARPAADRDREGSFADGMVRMA